MDADSFIRDGYVAVRGAVDADTVAACQELIWQAMATRGLRRDDPASWPPLLQIDDLVGAPFAKVGRSPVLKAAFDELIGSGRWDPLVDVGRALMRPPGWCVARIGMCPSSSRPTARRAPTPTRSSGGHRCCAGPSPTRPARSATFSCAIRSSCTPRPGRIAAPARAIVAGLAMTGTPVPAPGSPR